MKTMREALREAGRESEVIEELLNIMCKTEEVEIRTGVNLFVVHLDKEIAQEVEGVKPLFKYIDREIDVLKGNIAVDLMHRKMPNEKELEKARILGCIWALLVHMDDPMVWADVPYLDEPTIPRGWWKL